MKIARIGIKNMYNLKNLNLDFGDYYALVVGPNGCGKTNIIKCVEKAIKLAIRDIDHNRVEDLINYEQSDGENSFIRLDFKLNSTEISKLLKLRMISIVERTIRLCRLLLPAREQRILADLERIFLQKTVPLLLENLRSTIKDLKKWKSKDADVVISYVDAGLHFFEATTK